MPDSTQAPSLYGLLQTLEGLILINPAAVFHAALSRGVVLPSELFPVEQPHWIRHPVVPLTVFLRFLERNRPHPQGFM
jgi:hypothetical protein